jgi:drug/metabolite transporter (DMT)-like permease
MSTPGAGTGRDLKTEILLLAVIGIWAANYPLTKYGIAGLDILVFNAIRFVVAALVIAAIFVFRPDGRPVARSDWLPLLRTGVIASVFYQVAFIVGLSFTTAGNSAILLATAPLWTVVLHARLHKEPISQQVWRGMALSLIGVVLIVVGSGKKIEVGGTALAGDLICLGAAFLWAVNTNMQKPLLTRYSPVQVSLIIVAVGAVGLSAIAVPSAVTMSWREVHWTYYAAAVASGAASIGVANVFWSYGVKRLGPSRTGNFGNLTPVMAFVFSYLTLHEEIGVLQIAGAAITLGGIWYARR